MLGSVALLLPGPGGLPSPVLSKDLAKSDNNVAVLFTSHICTGEVVLTADEVLNEDGNPGVVIRSQRTLLKHA